MKVLYIEDDPVDIDVTLRSFRKNAKNIELSIARSQREAVEIIKSPDLLNFDLILTDMHLGDGDGIALLSHIRSRSIQIPVVILTGQGDEESTVAAFKAGADNYVIKKYGYLSKLPRFLEETYISNQNRKARRTQKLNILYVEHNQVDVDLTLRHFKKHAPHIHISVIFRGTEFLALLRRPQWAFRLPCPVA